MITTKVGRTTFQLMEEHRFQWLEELGDVFTVFDQQDSGNLSFGVIINGVKKFVKYAGAKPIAYKGEPHKAVELLRQSVTNYHDLQHEHLVHMVDHFATPEGYALLFDWFDGECLHSHWSFPPPAKYNNPLSPSYRYMRLSEEHLLASIDSILSFHVHVERAGYVAVDFYDGSILYNFSTHTTKICDIDYYQKKPLVNQMGRMWGSKRFMSPEEFTLNAPIDERTNVFNMGATIFVLAGGESDRSYEKWQLNSRLYEVAMKAVQPDRDMRYRSVAEMYEAWKQAQ